MGKKSRRKRDPAQAGTKKEPFTGKGVSPAEPRQKRQNPITGGRKVAQSSPALGSQNELGQVGGISKEWLTEEQLQHITAGNGIRLDAGQVKMTETEAGLAVEAGLSNDDIANLTKRGLQSLHATSDQESLKSDPDSSQQPQRLTGDWRSDERDFETRKEILQQVDLLLKRMQRRSPENYSREWTENLPRMVKGLEKALYRNAPSFEVYSDISTIGQRIWEGASRYIETTEEVPVGRKQESALVKQVEHMIEEMLIKYQENEDKEEFLLRLGRLREMGIDEDVKNTIVRQTVLCSLRQKDNKRRSMIQMLCSFAEENVIPIACYERAAEDLIDETDELPVPENLWAALADFILSGILDVVWICQRLLMMKAISPDSEQLDLATISLIKSIAAFDKGKAPSLLFGSANKDALVDFLGEDTFWTVVSEGCFTSADDCIVERKEAMVWIRTIELSRGWRTGICPTCGKEAQLHLCAGKCYGNMAYCGRKCQQKHWKTHHHKECRRIKDNFAVIDYRSEYRRRQSRSDRWREKNNIDLNAK